MRDSERVVGQIERGEVRVGPEAAREIARRIEAQHGFWDLELRKEEKRNEDEEGGVSGCPRDSEPDLIRGIRLVSPSIIRLAVEPGRHQGGSAVA